MNGIFVVSTVFLAAASAADLPVKEVILYKHGVGFFERAGDLKSGESARLDFKAAEMNDVLKSLTIEDRGGGKVTGVRYDSNEPLSQKLGEFPFQVDGQKPLSSLLSQVQGAQLELQFGPDKVSGIIVGARSEPPTDKAPGKEQVSLMLPSGELRTLDLSAATGIHFSDVKLQMALKDYLSALVVSRSRDKRSVYIDSSDARTRSVIASYMIPAPVWKSSYRLIFAPSGEAKLEGWAIVDNTTGEDWTNIKLALVSGRPISFITSLYEPKYVQRPTAELAENQAVAPVVYEGAMASSGNVMAAAPPPPPPAPAQQSGKLFAPMAKQVLRGAAAEQMGVQRSDMNSSIDVSAQGQELGELFEYRFSSPVTVKKSESAMLPFLQQNIGASKLLIYSDQNSQHPLNAVGITNSTGKTLDGGPITVYDNNAYAGEALVETLKAGDKRLISYGVDLGTRITTKFDSSRDMVREVHLNRGVLTTRSAVQETRTYTIRNVDQKGKTLIIEQPVQPGYKLINTKASETTASAWRFQVKLGAGASETFPVTTERLYDSTIAISSQNPNFLLTYIQNKTLSDAARQQLQRIVDQKRQITAADSEIKDIDGQINEIVRDQERIRQNLSSLNSVAGQQDQVQKYARQLSTQESQLATLRDRQSAARKSKAALEADLNKLIESSSF